MKDQLNNKLIDRGYQKLILLSQLRHLQTVAVVIDFKRALFLNELSNFGAVLPTTFYSERFTILFLILVLQQN